MNWRRQKTAIGCAAVIAGVAMLAGACNPFAPDLEEGDPFGDILGDPTRVEVLRAFRDAEFEGGRHERRLGKVKAIDDRMRREATSAGPSAGSGA